MVTTEPRLPNGTPFPTTYYLTCPRVDSRIGTLEASGLMKEMQDRLGDGPRAGGGLRAGRTRPTSPTGPRSESGELDVPEIEGISAGGMPARVKCLHVLAAHALAAGPGSTRSATRCWTLLGDWWASGPCVEPGAAEP